MSVVTINCPKCGKVGSFDLHGIPKPGGGGRSCRHCHKHVYFTLDSKGNVVKAT